MLDPVSKTILRQINIELHLQFVVRFFLKRGSDEYDTMNQCITFEVNLMRAS